MIAEKEGINTLICDKCGKTHKRECASIQALLYSALGADWVLEPGASGVIVICPVCQIADVSKGIGQIVGDFKSEDWLQSPEKEEPYYNLVCHICGHYIPRFSSREEAVRYGRYYKWVVGTINGQPCDTCPECAKAGYKGSDKILTYPQ